MTPCVASATSGSARTSPSGSRPASSPPATWPRSSERWDCWACTCRGTAAPAPRSSRTGWPATSSRRSTRDCAAWCRCRDPWRCTRSTATAARSTSSSGSRRWPPVRRSAASASPSPTPDPTPRRCVRVPAATEPTGCSTAASSGSPTARWPTSPWCGPAPTTASAASSSPPMHRASPRTSCSTSCRCVRRRAPSSSSTVSGCPPRRCSRRHRGSPDRCRASTRRASASCSARSAPAATAWRPPSRTPPNGRSSASRSRPSS